MSRPITDHWFVPRDRWRSLCDVCGLSVAAHTTVSPFAGLEPTRGDPLVRIGGSVAPRSAWERHGISHLTFTSYDEEPTTPCPPISRSADSFTASSRANSTAWRQRAAQSVTTTPPTLGST